MHRKYPLQLAVLLGVFIQTFDAVAQPASQPLPESPKSTIGYENVNEAMKALRSRSGVLFTTENGWLIATDKAALTIWSFAPEGYPAYPAVVKRQAIPRGENASNIQMTVQCGASKEACDALVKTFAEMNGFSL